MVSLFFTSCKKDDETIIQLNVSSFVNGNSIVDGEVSFYIKSLSNNTYSSSFDLVESGLTDWEGKYPVSIIKTSSDIAYQFIVSKEGFLSKTIEVNPANISASEINLIEAQFKPVADLSFRLVSSAGATSSDQIFFTFNNDNEVGTSFNSFSLQGNVVDTTITTQVLADKFNHYTYVINRNGNYTQFEDSVYCPIGGNVFQVVDL